MGQISRFRGISVEMYYRDHGPAHFHVYYADEHATVSLDTMDVMQGRLSPRVRRTVLEWARRNSEAVRDNWHRAMALEPLEWIEPDE